MSTASVKLTIQFTQNMHYLHLVTGASRLLCETIKASNLPGSFVDDVELAVSEACTNAIRHAVHADASAMVTVSFYVNEAQLIIEISDQGAGFDFDAVSLPDFDQHPEGGYGLYVIRKMMDEVLYTRGVEINTLTMKKDLKMKGECRL